jgi:putative salt-induced outer membrane protein YdiY
MEVTKMRKTFFAATVLTFSAALAWADEVRLLSGETLTVTDVKAEGGRVHMVHPVLGRLDVPATQVTEIKRTDGTKLSGYGEPIPEPPPKWKFRAELGLNGSSGNTRTQDLRAAIGALLETSSERWKFDAVYLKSKTEGEVTKKNWYVAGLHDWLFKDSPWLLFATARYDWDEFQPWDSRISVGVGAGYALVKTEETQVRLRAGFFETREDGGPNDGHWRPEGMLGAEGVHHLTKSQTLEGAISWFPDLQEAGEYRIVASAAWSVKLSDNGLSLKAGVEEEYDTHRESPYERADVKYFVALLYEF